MLAFLFVSFFLYAKSEIRETLRSARCNVEVDACAESGNLTEIYVTQHYKDVRLLAKKYYYHKRVCGEHTTHNTQMAGIDVRHGFPYEYKAVSLSLCTDTVPPLRKFYRIQLLRGTE